MACYDTLISDEHEVVGDQLIIRHSVFIEIEWHEKMWFTSMGRIYATKMGVAVRRKS